MRHDGPRRAKGLTQIPRAGNPKRRGLTAAARSRGVVTPSSDGTAGYLPSGTVGQWQPVTGQWRTERKLHHVISVRRHLTKNWPGLPQKSSETPSTALLVKRGRGSQGPRCANTEWCRGAFLGFSKDVAAPTDTRAGSPAWRVDGQRLRARWQLGLGPTRRRLFFTNVPTGFKNRC